MREDENPYHRRDPQVARGVRCSKVTLRSAEWEATPLPMTDCSDRQGDPVETVAEGGSAYFLGHSISLVSYRLFIRMLSVLEIGSF